MTAACWTAPAPATPRGTVAFSVGVEQFSVLLGVDADARVTEGVVADPDVAATADPATFFALADGRLTTARAIRESGLAVTGDRRLLDRLLTASAARALAA